MKRATKQQFKDRIIRLIKNHESFNRDQGKDELSKDLAYIRSVIERIDINTLEVF